MKTCAHRKLAWLAGIALGAVTVVAADQNNETLALPVRCTEPRTELDWQYASLLNDLRERNRIVALSNQTCRSDALILSSDRDPADVVARRTAALLSDQKRSLAPHKLSAWEDQLRALRNELTGVPIESAERRYALYEKLCVLRRQIAFANP